jgi:hypothetical protein
MLAIVHLYDNHETGGTFMARAIPHATRRQYLRGSGVLLPLPFLPSLLRSPLAHAAPPRPRFVAMVTNHGAVWESNMFPQAGMLTDQVDFVPGHVVRYGKLRAASDGADAVLSPVLRAPRARLTDPVVAKLNVLMGLDVPFYTTHNSVQLGNYGAVGGGNDNIPPVHNPRPSIDQIMAYSPTFYPDPQEVRQRAILSSRGGLWALSHNHANPTARTGAVQEIHGTTDLSNWFERLFSGPSPAAGPQRKPILDRVRQNYNSLRQSNHRLSQLDKLRLEAHVSALDEVERRFTVKTVCAKPAAPPGAGEYSKAWAQSWNSLVAAGLACSVSRIAVMGYHQLGRLVTYSGNWHQDIAHMWTAAGPQNTLLRANQIFFQDIFLDLVTKLEEVVLEDGSRLLDRTLVMWSQESGMATHECSTTPVVTAGGAGGAIKTGLFVDYRRVGNARSRLMHEGQTQWMGVLYAQFLATCLQAMGVPRAEFERWGHRGYGYPFVSGGYGGHYGSTSSEYFARASDILPALGT